MSTIKNGTFKKKKRLINLKEEEEKKKQELKTVVGVLTIEMEPVTSVSGAVSIND